MDFTREQPSPRPNNGTPIWDLVIADMHKRDHLGRERYGTPLQVHNGRDMLRDAYEEALDLAVYLRGAILERDGEPTDDRSDREMLDCRADLSRRGIELSPQAERKLMIDERLNGDER